MEVRILEPGASQNEQLPSGRWFLLRDYNLEIGGELFCCPAGFDHDGSSWPRCLPGPRQSRIMSAGIIHDYGCRYGTHGEGGRKLSYMEVNRIWYHVALAGEEKAARASRFWALMGRAGLFFGCWPTWMRYRRLEGVVDDS